MTSRTHAAGVVADRSLDPGWHQRGCPQHVHPSQRASRGFSYDCTCGETGWKSREPSSERQRRAAGCPNDHEGDCVMWAGEGSHGAGWYTIGRGIPSCAFNVIVMRVLERVEHEVTE